MDSLSLSLVILVFFVPLLVFFATVRLGAGEEAPDNGSEREERCESFARLQRPRPRLDARWQAQVRESMPVLRQNVAVARLMRMEGTPVA